MSNRIYAYTVTGRDAERWERVLGQTRVSGIGLIKVGQTTKRSARERIKQQLGAAYPNLDGVEILLDEPAAREDGSEFRDHDVHAALVGEGIRRPEYGLRLAAQQDETPEQAIGRLIDYLPIFGFKGGAMSPLDASDVLDWATAGVGATALAKQWNSPVLVEVNERTLSALLDHPGLLETLSQIEDFREEALKHVIGSLDPALFEQVTGLTIADFKLLSEIGLFNARNMDAAIYQFRQFERRSLRYAESETADEDGGGVGLWERGVDSV